jgi:hypothetical protein
LPISCACILVCGQAPLETDDVRSISPWSPWVQLR